MNFTHHGGDCCGRCHIFGFEEYDDEDCLPTVQDFRDAVKASGNLCIEVVLTRDQIDHGTFCGGGRMIDAVLDAGFREVFSFRNPNTGNECVVFLKAGDPIRVPTGMVFDPTVDPRPERRVILSEYHGRFIDGSISRPYINELDARQALPRCRHFIRRDIWSDEEIQIIEL